LNLGAISIVEASAEEIIAADRESLGVVRVVVSFLQGPEHLL